MKILQFPPCCRTNRSVTCGSQSMKLMPYNFDSSIPFPPFFSLLGWQNVVLGYCVGNCFPLILSVRPPSSFWVYTFLSSRLRHTHLVSFLCPQPGASGRGDGTLVLNLSLAHVLRHEWRISDSVWTEKRQTDVPFAHLATWRYSCIWPPTLFVLVGEGIISFIGPVFLSSLGRMPSSHSWRWQEGSGARAEIFLNLDGLAEM